MGTPELPVPDGLVLQPFRGVRFAVEDPAKVTSPPYDLISDAGVDALLDSHPNNVVRLILPCAPRTQPATSTPQAPSGTTATARPTPQTPSGTTATARPTPQTTVEPHPSAPALAPTPPELTPPPPAEPPTPIEGRYAEARDTLRAWLDSGVLVADDVPALYVYEQSGPNMLQRGLIGDVALADPAQHIILPHEDVVPGPIADRLALMSTTQANLEPIFLLYNGENGTTTSLVDDVAMKRQPLVSAHTEDGLTHRLWAITDATEIAAINADLHPRQALIADGHHRYATYRVLQRQEHATHHKTPQPPSTPEFPPTTASADQPQAHPAATQKPQPPLTAHPEHPGRTQPGQSGPTPIAQPGQAHPTFGGTEPETPAPEGLVPETLKPETPELTTQEPQAPKPETPEPATQGPKTPEPTTGPWDFGLALLVDSSAYPPNLQAIHRVIPGLPLAEAVAKARNSWRVHDYDNLAQGLAALEAATNPSFLLAGATGTHLLTDPDPVQLARAMPTDHSDRWNSLNTSVLAEFVLPVVWGMRDDEQSVRIVHHDTDAALSLAIRTGGTAVILQPLAVDDVLAVAASGERVPRKSTSFGPKPRTGLVLRTFAID
ncbi:DUF1015 family protein [Nonomuraea jiangxiensis]|uniref:DUF1015 domain-containing protein n=1 Tax=Nonomuraea jiangxiensis TaxID=633440 RepID=A0A1G9GYD5_9ACTN|nr:DUF1015 domain-containing protein [Nonomuraea jiangxiensis]SDL05605.1 Protein of unknown function [Nonomuraea jiangxiensis]